MKKFFAVIGNPPYQESIEGTSDKPVYHFFLDEAYLISDHVELITPARFLFNAGKTPKDWNKKILADPHIKVQAYEHDSNSVFPNANIVGGVAVTYRDAKNIIGPIGVFSPFDELRRIKEKVLSDLEGGNISSIMHYQNRFILNELYADYPEAKELVSSEGRERRIVTSAFSKLAVFSDTQKSQKDIRILGVVDRGKRVYKWINSKYVEDNGTLDFYKVMQSKSNGASGTLGEKPARMISAPEIAEPGIGHTQTFLSIGNFETREGAESLLKYIKTKFARALLGLLKITQDNSPETWKYVPLQDFSPSSDINWSKSIAEIDQQLYKKYDLSEDEIAFIESHVKEMQ